MQEISRGFYNLVAGAAQLRRKPKLFVSHSSADNTFVTKLCADLNVLGVDTWLDSWELSPGDSLNRCIGAALEAAQSGGLAST